MRTIRVSDTVYDGLVEVADREGISMASVIDRLLTFPCDICGEPMFPNTHDSFRIFMKGKTQAMKTWGHKTCHDKEKKE